ncbi:hypothetical protein PybrP1_001964, partial [[Pythium] brassicae (nom. inval.)]
MEICYEKGSDVTRFFLELEQAVKPTADATNSVMNDEQKSIYIYHSMPSAWKSSLMIWKENHKFIPYEELKQNIEQRVRDDFAKNKYIQRQGTPEARETRAEKVLAATTCLVTQSKRSCAYCHGNNHDAKDCQTLQRHLSQLNSKPGIRLQGRAALQPTKQQQRVQQRREQQRKGKRFQPYAKTPRERSNDFKKPNNGGDGNAIFDKNGNRLDQKVLTQFSKQMEGAKRVDDGKYFQRHQRDFGIVVVVASEEVALATVAPRGLDNVWIVDTGSTRHVAYQREWFDTMAPGGSVSFDKSGKCSLWYQNRVKIAAEITPATGLYHFKANVKPARATSLAATLKDESFLLWHKRVGHPNFLHLQATFKQQTVEGLSAPGINIQRLSKCLSCIYAKSHRQPFNNILLVVPSSHCK